MSRVEGVGLRVYSFEFSVSCFGRRISGFGVMVPGFGFRFHDSEVREKGSTRSENERQQVATASLNLV